jgi:hypothetical protein
MRSPDDDDEFDPAVQEFERLQKQVETLPKRDDLGLEERLATAAVCIVRAVSS